jgi:phage-related protein
MEGAMKVSPKPLLWIASSREDLRSLPPTVRGAFGVALFMAQNGATPANAKPLKGFRGAGVLQVVEDWVGNTYRAIYTVRFAKAVYVLHAFQKKSKRGIETPRSDLDLIRRRLDTAQHDYEQRIQRGGFSHE